MTKAYFVNYLDNILAGKIDEAKQGIGLGVNGSLKQLTAGVIQFQPVASTNRALILSCGVHGDETAPMEVIQVLIRNLICNRVALNCNLLIIFANLDAVQQQKRFCQENLNRLFKLDESKLDNLTLEASRAKLLIECLEEFSSCYPNFYHLDLHSSIYDSYFPIFTILPKIMSSVKGNMGNGRLSLSCDASIQSNSPSNTFSYYTANRFGAVSATVELGQSKPFKQNDLTQFNQFYAAVTDFIQGLDSATQLPFIVAKHQFKVHQVLIKKTKQFRFTAQLPIVNFTQFSAGYCVSTDGENQPYHVGDESEYICFANPGVPINARAGLMLKQL
ncbi:succinylglutamate desuccinylase [Catenovulum maritimum]|uniref:Succinylglutamate desuccinylase n=1 Tax=Catenovulum maritimum TaxID=1513271 RepID=A0A0J8GRE4_9ALTE|nr:succinylglutamate desuccinylase [Catenovulum maritimum]KMT63834.1 hypothetical protein XM47_17645 [Catenovulum maritimum]